MVQKSLSTNFGPELLDFLQNRHLFKSTKTTVRLRPAFQLTATNEEGGTFTRLNFKGTWLSRPSLSSTG